MGNVAVEVREIIDFFFLQTENQFLGTGFSIHRLLWDIFARCRIEDTKM